MTDEKMYKKQTLDNVVVEDFDITHVMQNVKPRFHLNALVHLQKEGIFINEASGKASHLIQNLK